MEPIGPALHIRDAKVDDLAAINDIYNHYVRTSTCTYQYEPETMEARAAWFARHGGAHPVTVAVAGGEDDQILGWGALSDFRGRVGYRFSVENSVYVRHDRQGRGIGRALLADLVERARRLGHHTIVAGISAEQAASIALHERAGFRTVARLAEVGYKFERWLDIVFMQLML